VAAIRESHRSQARPVLCASTEIIAWKKRVASDHGCDGLAQADEVRVGHQGTGISTFFNTSGPVCVVPVGPADDDHTGRIRPRKTQQTRRKGARVKRSTTTVTDDKWQKARRCDQGGVSNPRLRRTRPPNMTRHATKHQRRVDRSRATQQEHFHETRKCPTR